MPILWRYIFKGYFKPLLICSASLVLLLLISKSQSIANLVSTQTSAKNILTIALLQIPQILIIALPIAALLASMTLSSSLCENKEIIACLSSGISFKYVFFPLNILSATLSTFNLYNCAELTPKCKIKSFEFIKNFAEETPFNLIKNISKANGSYSYIDFGKPNNEKIVENILLGFQNDSNESMSLVVAKKIEARNTFFTGKNISIITTKKNQNSFDDLFIDNVGKMEMELDPVQYLLKSSPKKEGLETLSFSSLIEKILECNKKSKPQFKNFYELFKRLFYPLSTYFFSILGFSAGLGAGRVKRKSRLFVVFGLPTFTLVCSIIAKSLQPYPYYSIIFLVIPFPLLALISYQFRSKYIRGIE